jgi:hypothetical protein
VTGSIIKPRIFISTSIFQLQHSGGTAPGGMVRPRLGRVHPVRRFIEQRLRF